MCAIWKARVNADDNALNFVPTSPLGITRMTFHPSDILSNFGIDTLQQEIIDRIKSVGENELAPGKNTKLIARGVKVITTGQLV